MKKKRLSILALLLLLALLLGGCAYFGKGVDIIVEPLPEEEARLPDAEETLYVLNTKTHKFHLPECESVKDIQPENREEYTGSRFALLEDGYSPCKRCNP